MFQSKFQMLTTEGFEEHFTETGFKWPKSHFIALSSQNFVTAHVKFCKYVPLKCITGVQVLGI